MSGAYLTLLRRDIRLGLARGSEGMVTLFFFVVTASLFPIALGGDPALISRAAPGILWVSAILASLLSLETLFHRDAEDGTLDLLLLSKLSSFGLALAKMAGHWTVSGFTLVLVGLVVSQMLFIPPAALPVLLPSLLLGTVYMSLMGGMGAALTFGARRPGLLLALLILPLYIPMLILGMMVMEAARPAPFLLLQAALVIAALPLAAGVAAFSFRTQLRA